MNHEVTIVGTKAFSTFEIDSTPYIALGQFIETPKDQKFLITISELGESPVLYEIYDDHLNMLDLKRIIPEIIDEFVYKEYRLVTLADGNVLIHAYRSKRMDSCLCTLPFTIDTPDYKYSAVFFKVHDDSTSYYRFITYDQDYHFVVVEAVYPQSDDDIGIIFEALLKEFIRVARISHQTSASCMDIWDLSNSTLQTTIKYKVK